MKLLQSYHLFGIVLILCSCIQPVKDENPLVGTWHLITSERIENGNQIPVRDSESTSKYIKTINSTHFSTLWQDVAEPETSGYNGGDYALVDSIYTERLEYHSIENLRNREIHFKVQFVGELMILTSCDAQGQILDPGFVETWKRAKK